MDIPEELVPHPFSFEDHEDIPFNSMDIAALHVDVVTEKWLEPFQTDVRDCQGCELTKLTDLDISDDLLGCVMLQSVLSVRTVDEINHIDPNPFSDDFRHYESIRVLRHGAQRGLLGAELPFYHVIDRLSDSTFTVYPFLGEVFDQKTRNKYDGKVYYDGSDRFPWGRIEDLRHCLVAEEVVSKGTLIIEWSPATIVSKWEDWPLLVEFQPGYPAFSKHGRNRVKAFWAVPNTPQAREALAKLGHCVASTVEMQTQISISEHLIPHPFNFRDTPGSLVTPDHIQSLYKRLTLNRHLSLYDWLNSKTPPGDGDGNLNLQIEDGSQHEQQPCLVYDIIAEASELLFAWVPATILSKRADWPFVVQFQTEGLQLYDGGCVKIFWAVPDTPAVRNALVAAGETIC